MQRAYSIQGFRKEIVLSVKEKKNGLQFKDLYASRRVGNKNVSVKIPSPKDSEPTIFLDRAKKMTNPLATIKIKLSQCWRYFYWWIKSTRVLSVSSTKNTLRDRAYFLFTHATSKVTLLVACVKRKWALSRPVTKNCLDGSMKLVSYKTVFYLKPREKTDSAKHLDISKTFIHVQRSNKCFNRSNNRSKS